MQNMFLSPVRLDKSIPMQGTQTYIEKLFLKHHHGSKSSNDGHLSFIILKMEKCHSRLVQVT